MTMEASEQGDVRPEVREAREHGERLLGERARRSARRSAIVNGGIAVSITGLAATLLGVMNQPATRSGSFRLYLCGAALSFVGVFFAARAVHFAWRARSTWGLVGSIVTLILNYGMMFVGGFIAWASTLVFTRGRQLRSFGRPILPKVGGGASWARPGQAPLFVAELDEPTKRALADQWRENGRTEHASVAAFARLTLDLMALGAPPKLVEDANRDALDEIRHAEMCFSLARRIDGNIESPMAFPEAGKARTLPGNRTLALATLAVDSLIDGALHEGVSARIIAQLSRRTDDPVVRAMLKEIAADEGRHARHGWDVVRYCLEEGGTPVARALEGALRKLPTVMGSELPEAARSGAWEPFGIMGEALESNEFERARAELQKRVASLLFEHENRLARSSAPLLC